MIRGRFVELRTIEPTRYKALVEAGGRWFTGVLDHAPLDLEAPFDEPGVRWEELPVVVPSFYAPSGAVPVTSAEPIVYERPTSIEVDGERVRVGRCERCWERVAVNFHECDEPYGVPTRCADCSTACGDCCGWYEHIEADAIRAEARRLGWPA